MTPKTMTDNGLRKAVAHWLRSGMDGAGLNQTSLADRSGVARETVWRLLHGKSDANEWTLRRLAQAMGREIPPIGGRAERRKGGGTTGRRDDGTGEPTSAVARAIGGSPASSDVDTANVPSSRRPVVPSPNGWLFGDPTEAEEQFLSFLRNIERTTRAMVGNPDLFSIEENRINQLAVCRAAMRSAELVGRPVPSWLTRIYNEVIGGAFR